MANRRLFEEYELELSKRQLNVWRDRSALRALEFYNALQTFMRDVERARGSSGLVHLLCVDASEIATFAIPNSGSRTAFTFGDLLVPRKSADASVDFGELDRLISHHLLFGREEGHVLLEPHAQEVFLLEKSAADFVSNTSAEFRASANAGGMWALSTSQLRSIQDWLTNTPSEQLPEEFDLFRETFLPGWRTGMAAELESKIHERNRINYYLRKGRFHLLSPPSTGFRSILSVLDRHNITLNWSHFEGFLSNDENEKEFDEVASTIQSMAKVLQGSKKRHRWFDEAVRRDAHAFATMHLTNKYFAKNHFRVRIEFISRSRSLLDIIGALPEGRMRVTVRHPLLVPEIYDFNQGALQSLGDVFQALDGAISPFIDAHKRVEHSNLTSDMKLLEQIQNPALELVDVLSDSITIQQTLEQSPDLEKSIGSVFRFNSTPTQTGAGRGDIDHNLVKEIAVVFKLISQALSESRDPFSRSAVEDISAKNALLVNFERSASYPSGTKILSRVVEIPIEESTWPIGFYAIRFLGGSFSRIFHLYSVRTRQFVSSFASNRADEFTPCEVALPSDALFDLANLAFENLSSEKASNERQSESKPDQNDLVFNLEATLLSCMAFANRGRWQTAATIASTTLTYVMSEIRADPTETGSEKESFDGQFSEDVRVALACKELFLMRHYCERAISAQQLRVGKVSIRTTKGDASRNMARAQRDLDAAVYMNEVADRRARKLPDICISSKQGTPTGKSLFDDLRFPLIHSASWIEQYLSVAFGSGSEHKNHIGVYDEVGPMRTRLDIWTAAGLSKELEVVAWRACRIASSSSGSDTRRYYFHLEARALQNLLAMFIVFLAVDTSPDILTFWNRELRPSPDRILVFRNWSTWHKRFEELRAKYSFEMRISPVFNLVLPAISFLDDARIEGRVRDFDAELQSLVDALRKLRESERGSSDFFLVGLINSLIARLESLY